MPCDEHSHSQHIRFLCTYMHADLTLSQAVAEGKIRFELFLFLSS